MQNTYKTEAVYRVYDTENKKWINNVCLTPDGLLFSVGQSFFNRDKISSMLSQDRYVYHKSINLYDVNNVLVYEGDYIKGQVSEDKTVTGIVIYASELSSYILLCLNSDEYYSLGTDICKYIKVIGNIFDGYKSE